MHRGYKSAKSKDKKDKYIIKQFTRFLKDNKSFDRFVYLCYNGVLCTSNPARKERNFESFIVLMGQRNWLRYLIYRSFAWAETNEGYTFWSRLDMKWRDLYDKITN